MTKKKKTEFVFRDKISLYSAGGWEGIQQTADVTCAQSLYFLLCFQGLQACVVMPG